MYGLAKVVCPLAQALARTAKNLLWEVTWEHFPPLPAGFAASCLLVLAAAMPNSPLKVPHAFALTAALVSALRSG